MNMFNLFSFRGIALNTVTALIGWALIGFFFPTVGFIGAVVAVTSNLWMAYLVAKDWYAARKLVKLPRLPFLPR